ncbi:MAG: protein kinase [Phycisphaerales bacterium]|nr:protein kinase [Phycisphaerales bacterium]
MASADPGSGMTSPTSHADMAPCSRVSEVQRALRTVLSDEEQASLAAHLNECDYCRRIGLGEQAASELQDELRQAVVVRDQLDVDINLPLSRLNTLLTDYEIIREIGRGGMGIVYEARQLKLDRIVALKVLPALLSALRPDAAARFRREATLVAGLDHSNIIGVYDFGEVEGSLFYAMQLIKGRSLRDVIQEIGESEAIDAVIGDVHDSQLALANGRGTTSDAEGSDKTRLGSSAHTDRIYYRRVALWMAEVAEALHYAHEQGVIHRDIKPSNLLLSHDGRLMVSDFGLAHAADDATLTREQSLLGTARYASPEQLSSDRSPIDRRADVYGLGATFYELLTFRPMFAARTDRELLNCVLHADPAPPRRLVPQVPRELETICMTAVEKDRRRRFDSAQALGDDLRRYLLDMPIHVRPPALPERVRRFVRRRKLAVTVAAASTLLIATTVSFSLANRTLQNKAAVARAAEQAERQRALLLASTADFVQGNYEEGLRKVDEFLVHDPLSVDARVLRAQFLGHLRREDEAQTVLEDVVVDSPDSWTAHRALVVAYHACEPEKAAFHQAQVERLQPKTATDYLTRSLLAPSAQDAIEMLTQALEHTPDCVDVLVQRAVRYRQVERLDLMLADADRAILLRPGWTLPHRLRGQALLGLGRYEETIACFDQAIRLEPQRAEWWYFRATAKCQIEQYDEAIADANVALQYNPKLASAYISRGVSRMASGDLDGGLADFDKAIELTPGHPNLYHDRGIGFLRAGLYDQARDSISRCIELLGPNDKKSFAYRSRAMVNFCEEKYDQAVADYTKAIEGASAPPITDFHHRASAALKTRRYKLTIADCTHVIQQLDREYASGALLNRCIAHLRMGDRRKAMADLAHAHDLDPEHPDFLRTRANVSIVLSDYRQAITDLARMIEEGAEGRIDSMMKLAFAYEMTGDTDKALAEYDRLEQLRGEAATYAVLWRYLLFRRLGDDGAASELLLRKSPTGKADEEWTDSLIAFLRETMTVEDLIAAAKTGAHRCEAYYFVGMLADAEGRTEDARNALRRCIQFDEWEAVARFFAPARLAALR